MKLTITKDDGTILQVMENIEKWNFSNDFDRMAFLGAIEKVVMVEKMNISSIEIRDEQKND